MRHLQSLLACALLALAALACAWPALDKSSLFTAAGSTTADTPQQTATVSGQSLPEGWTAMPAGARSTYLGIHGGTVPVSLLVSTALAWCIQWPERLILWGLGRIRERCSQRNKRRPGAAK